MRSLNLPSKLAPTPKNSPRLSVNVKSINGAEEQLADPRAVRALLLLMNQHAVIGGAACHWGGPAAFAEIMSSIHAIMFRQGQASFEWHEQFNFVNDAGHCENGIYALRSLYGFDHLDNEALKKFRSIESKLTGHGEGHLNPEGVLISNGPLGSGLPQAQGLALADKVFGRQRTTICTISDGAAMEGEAKEAFAAIPGLAAKGKLAPFVMAISDNNTKLSGRIDKDSFSMEPTFKSLATLGWDLRVVEDGNNLEAVHQTIEKAIVDTNANSTKPIAILFKTIKGKGIKATEESSSGGHGYPLKAYDDKLLPYLEEVYLGSELPGEFRSWAREILDSTPAPSTKQSGGIPTEKVQVGFAKAAIEAAKQGLPVFSISADLQGSTGIAPFHKEFPDQSLDIGVAESNMVSAAVGMSKAGMIPIVDTFAQFGITKGNLPLIMAGLSQAPIIGLFSHAGFQDAADGASHQATSYLSAVSSIPHVTAVVCSCSQEAETYLLQAIQKMAKGRENGDNVDSVVFFFGRENHPVFYGADVKYKWGKIQILADGQDVVILACGPMVPKALQAREQLAREGISAAVVNAPFANKPDIEDLLPLLEKCGNRLVTVEDHQQVAGMGQLWLSALAKEGVHPSITTLGISGEFGQSAYTADELYDRFGIGVDGIVAAASELVR
ncbi:MAG: transketolase [Bdellovibrionales bacterium CG12_big_fil_rev_8_21_14_0_65_38_15]|nr:MAG: transketolase [Bdellovibrionales bacterium CG22_combo_CG10-13_8_21_14_all_38_13]PIQ57207.1 MAG: transketolase [Bdellovibrionales bacterium CG12_big_fil_rev_8_21_14_0_65_38_15]PIR31401.1 MAG: transketolase [Bdellovibrionales bacterium CG11_big_fil_rev_8_21_14_0_20_38_13]